MNKKSLIIFLVIDAVIVAGLTYYFLNAYLFNADQPSITPPSEVLPEEAATEGMDMPTPAVQAKIDPQVACESALMYTTFTDGAAAEAFVADCVAGEHPEVIERYITDLNLPAGAQI